MNGEVDNFAGIALKGSGDVLPVILFAHEEIGILLRINWIKGIGHPLKDIAVGEEERCRIQKIKVIAQDIILVGERATRNVRLVEGKGRTHKIDRFVPGVKF